MKGRRFLIRFLKNNIKSTESKTPTNRKDHSVKLIPNETVRDDILNGTVNSKMKLLRILLIISS